MAILTLTSIRTNTLLCINNICYMLKNTLLIGRLICWNYVGSKVQK